MTRMRIEYAAAPGDALGQQQASNALGQRLCGQVHEGLQGQLSALLCSCDLSVT